MRHCIYLTVLFSVISNVMLAQNHDYVILRMTTEANVRYKGADEWQPLKEKDVVNLFDVIDLVGDGTVSIMKTATRAVYSTSDTEPATVYDVIRKAEDKHMGVVRNVFKEAVSDNSAKKSDFSSYGASVRGQESGSIQETPLRDLRQVPAPARQRWTGPADSRLQRGKKDIQF